MRTFAKLAAFLASAAVIVPAYEYAVDAESRRPYVTETVATAEYQEKIQAERVKQSAIAACRTRFALPAVFG